MRSALINRLSSPYASTLIILIALALTASSLTTGLVADDYYHKLVLTGVGDIPDIPTDPFELFVWAKGDEKLARSFMETGMTGWWTDPGLVLAFWRPVTVLTHWLDYHLWPQTPFLMHLQNLSWFAVALVVLWNLYIRLHFHTTGRWTAALALLMFAWDDAHGLTISWVANRSALVAFTFALLALLLYHRARQQGCGASAIAAPLVFALALGAGEISLGICAYLFAYALFIDPSGWKKGLIHLSPYALVVLLWSGFYYLMGYGARASGLVIDPVREPTAYVLAVLERLPILLLGQIAVPPTDLWEFYPALSRFLPFIVMAWALFALAAVTLAIWPVIARENTTRFWLCGGLLSALPACAQFPHDRLLLFIGIGLTAVLARFIAAFLDHEEWLARSALGKRGVGVVAGALIFLHLLLAPSMLPFRARGPADIGRMIARADSSIDDSPAVREKSVILINPPVDALAGYIPTLRAATGRNRPKHLRWLATGACDLEIKRLDSRTLRVKPTEGFLFLASERMQRNPRNRMGVGYTVAFSDLQIRVERLTSDARPAEITATFHRALEDRRYEFLKWSREGFVRFDLPEIDETVKIKAVDFISLLK
ncbi:MAG: hypothetical protein JXA30_02105 [Deltaproteobacteria bacterium]|nr:hypothetical protein [Deltaproteobacteria bacterium]